MSIGFGTTAKVGHLYPSGGLCDYEIQLMAPAGVQFLTTRLPFSRAGVENDIALVTDLERHSRLLADAAVDLIAVNCTAATMIAGADSINQRVQDATGIASVTTIEAVMNALKAAGVRDLVLLTPYQPEVVAMEDAFLGRHGLRVLAHAGDPCSTPVEQGNIPPARWVELAHSVKDIPADGLLISCAGVQLSSVIGEIETDFGRPVIASNAALLWQVLTTLGITSRPVGYGAVLSGEFD
jgi:maleate isomerase